MKELTTEQKAKAYDEALERMKSWVRGEHPECFTEAQKAAEFIFPELRESEDEQSKNWILEYLYDGLRKSNEQFKEQFKAAIAWLEKQGEPLENYDEAEKEKFDFVGDGFIKCYANFQDFKEGETYWLEYIGDDKYNVRSDNLLGKTYHITPCQLYTVFEKLTWLEKQGNKKSVKTIVETWKDMRLEVYQQASGNRHELNYSDDTTKMFSLDDIDEIMEKMSEQKESLCDKCKKAQPSHSCQDITALGRCAVEHEQNTIDKVEPKFKVGDTMRTLQEAANGYTDGMPVVISVDKEYYHCTNELIAIKDQDDYEFPPINVKHNPKEWSEEDECYMAECINAIATKDGWSFEEKRKTKHWLKSFKERIGG